MFNSDAMLRTHKPLTSRSHLSVAELSAAKITKKLQQLLPCCSVATLHKALIFFTEQTLNGIEKDALLRYATPTSRVNEPLNLLPLGCWLMILRFFVTVSFILCTPHGILFDSNFLNWSTFKPNSQINNAFSWLRHTRRRKFLKNQIHKILTDLN